MFLDPSNYYVLSHELVYDRSHLEFCSKNLGSEKALVHCAEYFFQCILSNMFQSTMLTISTEHCSIASDEI